MFFVGVALVVAGLSAFFFLIDSKSTRTDYCLHWICSASGARGFLCAQGQRNRLFGH